MLNSTFMGCFMHTFRVIFLSQILLDFRFSYGTKMFDTKSCSQKERRPHDAYERERYKLMNIDSTQINQLLSQIPYPIGKSHIVQFAQQHGANSQIMNALNMLPDKTFNSAQDIQNMLSGLKNVGSGGNLGGYRS